MQTRTFVFLAGGGKRPRQAGRPVPLGRQLADLLLWDRRPRLSLPGPAAFFHILLGVLLIGQVAFSQTFGSIGGEVHDATGAIIAGATVTAINIGTNASRTVATNDAGGYSFPSLPPGTYTVKVEKPGFKTVVRNQIELQVQLAARVDFELQVGQVSESIEVNARAFGLLMLPFAST